MGDSSTVNLSNNSNHQRNGPKICLLLLIAIGMVAALPAPGSGFRGLRRYYDEDDYDTQPRGYGSRYEDEEADYEPRRRAGRRGGRYRHCITCSTGWGRK